MKQLILASNSNGRRDLLKSTGIAFTVDASNYEEDMTLQLEPAELAKHLSKGKARDVASRHTDAVILGADSFAVYEGRLMGKPYTLERAKEMLTTLSAHAHTFITGFTIIDADTRREYSEAVETKVYFRPLSEPEIDGYLRKEGVLNQAGSYIVQGLGSILIDRIEGNYSNVVGLPMPHVARALKGFGVDLLSVAAE
jgi:septum formation protein